MHITVIYE